jgi:hypothetical protein
MKKQSSIRETCSPTNHYFNIADVTPRSQSFGQAFPSPAVVTPIFRLYCVKCGEVRPL